MFLYNGFAFNVLVHEVFFKWKINLKFRFGATPSHVLRNRGGTGARCPLTFVKIKKMCPFFIKNGPLEILTLQLFTLVAMLNTLLYVLKLYKIEKRIVHSIFSNLGGGGCKRHKIYFIQSVAGSALFWRCLCSLCTQA